MTTNRETPSSQSSPVEGEKTAHTPGPWKFQLTEESGECFIVATGLGGLVGAALPWPAEMDNRDFRRVIANARLIAAAPDLLKTLLDIEDAGLKGFLTPELCAEIVVDALSRAEGRDARKGGA